MEIIGWFFFGLIMSGVVAMIAGSKGRSALAWFFYGLLIWPIALVHILVTPGGAARAAKAARAEGRLPCPHCAEYIQPAAKVCPHCQREVTPWRGG